MSEAIEFDLVLLAEIRAVRDEVAALRRELEALRLARVTRAADSDVVLVPAISSAIGHRVFSSAELWRHAAMVDNSLRETFTALGIKNPQQLGKRLQALQGRVIDGLVVARGRDDNAGAQWAIEPAESDDALPHRHHVPCDTSDGGA